MTRPAEDSVADGEIAATEGVVLPAAMHLPLDSLDRGRGLAEKLREDGDPAAAQIVDELCNDVEDSRRKVARVGLDLHDEGLQDLAALRHDLHFFREQLSLALETPADRAKIVARVDDFLARVVSLDLVLREVAVSTQATTTLRAPLSVTLEQLVESYPGDCVVELSLDPDLDGYGLSDSQQITIARVVQSALSNILTHSHAKTASVAVRGREHDVETEIVDDGVGFVVEDGLHHAVEERRLGLLGMHERVQLLGGTFTLMSRPGGPTRVLFRLPRRDRD